MAAISTTSYQPNTTSKYYMNLDGGPSPPETPLYAKASFGGNLSQTPPSNNISPTSVHSACNVRQLRQPRQPMYVPAALRPTDRSARPTDIPTRPRPLDTPPTSKENSFDSGKAGSPHGSASSQEPIDFQQDVDAMDVLRRGLSFAGSEAFDDEPSEVTGPPTTAHWKPDGSSDACYICNATFTWYFRRHHCRRCGQLVCDSHIRHVVPLDQNARYHPQGTSSKACNTCWNGWKLVKKMQHSRTNSMASSSTSSQGTAMPIPSSTTRPNNDMRVGSMARSEGGMVWSTF